MRGFSPAPRRSAPRSSGASSKSERPTTVSIFSLLTRIHIERGFAQRVAESESEAPLWIDAIEQKVEIAAPHRRHPRAAAACERALANRVRARSARGNSEISSTKACAFYLRPQRACRKNARQRTAVWTASHRAGWPRARRATHRRPDGAGARAVTSALSATGQRADRGRPPAGGAESGAQGSPHSLR